MPNRLVVDFAALSSAGCVTDETKKVLYQFDSWGSTKGQFVGHILDTAKRFNVEIALIEDMPHGVKSQFMSKPAVRLQGRLIHEFYKADLLDILWFLQPTMWQRDIPGVLRKGPAGAAAAAAERGYEAPDMLTIHEADIPPTGGGPAQAKQRQSVRAKLKKFREDYNDAFLMGQWVQDRTLEELHALSGVQQDDS